MKKAHARMVGGLGLAALLVLHFDFWRGAHWPSSLSGLPGELVYRLTWMALAFLYFLWFLRTFWREEGER